MFAIVRRNEYT